ncbi:MAG TPA: hypothetical protein VGR74_17685, partial [Actinomycetota bacterium]|nr:hypothetical protein [Actinomycetota bacterium]
MGRPKPAALGDENAVPAGLLDSPLSASAERLHDQVDAWVRRHRDHDDSPSRRGGEHGEMVPDQR